jgi:hypothetical protein
LDAAGGELEPLKFLGWFFFLKKRRETIHLLQDGISEAGDIKSSEKG